MLGALWHKWVKLTAPWFWTGATTALSLQSNLAGSPSSSRPGNTGAECALARRYRSVNNTELQLIPGHTGHVNNDCADWAQSSRWGETLCKTIHRSSDAQIWPQIVKVWLSREKCWISSTHWLNVTNWHLPLNSSTERSENWLTPYCADCGAVENEFRRACRLVAFCKKTHGRLDARVHTVVQTEQQNQMIRKS